jgi:hypothetical protein
MHRRLRISLMSPSCAQPKADLRPSPESAACPASSSRIRRIARVPLTAALPSTRLPLQNPRHRVTDSRRGRLRRASIDAASIAIDTVRLRPRFALAPPRCILRGFRRCDMGFLLVGHALCRACGIGRPPWPGLEESEACSKHRRASRSAGPAAASRRRPASSSNTGRAATPPSALSSSPVPTQSRFKWVLWKILKPISIAPTDSTFVELGKRIALAGVYVVYAWLLVIGYWLLVSS